MNFDSDDQVIRDALAADLRLRDALHEKNVGTVERLYAPEFLRNSPTMRVQMRRETIDFVGKGQMRQVGVKRDIEGAYRSGNDVVVIMGYESLWINAPEDPRPVIGYARRIHSPTKRDHLENRPARLQISVGFGRCRAHAVPLRPHRP